MAKKNPYWLRSYHCFISFSELSVQKSSYSHKHSVILFNTRTLAQLVVILLIATLSQGLYYSGYIYTHSTAFRSINISTQLYWVSSPLTHSHARPYNQCVNDPCNTNGPTTAGDLLEHFNPGHLSITIQTVWCWHVLVLLHCRLLLSVSMSNNSLDLQVYCPVLMDHALYGSILFNFRHLWFDLQLFTIIFGLRFIN